jgi:hypothetical protein
MANQMDMQITEEGPRNAVVKFTGVLDTSDIQERPAVNIMDFKDNDERLTLVGFRVDLLEYVIGQGIEIQLEWDSNVPQQIFPLSGRGRIAATNYGGFVPDRNRSGYTGNINLITTGFLPGVPQNFTIILELVKLYSQ